MSKVNFLNNHHIPQSKIQCSCDYEQIFNLQWPFTTLHLFYEKKFFFSVWLHYCYLQFVSKITPTSSPLHLFAIIKTQKDLHSNFQKLLYTLKTSLNHHEKTQTYYLLSQIEAAVQIRLQNNDSANFHGKTKWN